MGLDKNKGIHLMADYVFLSKYAQKKPDGTLENWDEAIDRIYAMHEVKLKTLGKWSSSIENWLKKAKIMEENRIILSSQRARQFASTSMDDGILKHESKMYNCTSTLIDRPKVFSEIMYLLLSGCGVGYSLHKAHIDKLPVVKPIEYAEDVLWAEDSIEGWADVIDYVINSLYNGLEPNVMYDNIRNKGELIAGKFLAPGPEPLRKAVKHIEQVFTNAQGRKLKSIELHDILCYIAESVVCGGVRRSAMIALFDKDDKDMMNCKTGDWYPSNPQRAMANNSILTSYDDRLTYKEMQEMIPVIRQYGEPGLVNVPDYNWTVNPCGEIVMMPVFHYGSIDKTESGFAFCNLVEINAEACADADMFYEACEVSSFIATIQSLYTDFKYLTKTSQLIAERDRNIGVSITGGMANPILRGEVLRLGAKRVAYINQEISGLLGINHSRTCTTIKPSGNASSILGLICSGIHPAHDKKYLRRIRIVTNSPEYLALKDTPMVKVLRGDEAVISFPIEVKNDEGVIYKDGITAVEHIQLISHFKHYWINKGALTKGVVFHNVSATVEVDDREWEPATAVIYTHDYLFTGISMLPKLGDQIYDNAPFQRLSNPDLQKEFNDIVEFLNNNYIDFNEIMSGRADWNSGDTAAIACGGGSCELR